MWSGRAAAWTPAECEEARGADPGAPRLCGRVDTPAAEPGASQPRRRAPTRAPFPELEPGWHLCKPPQVGFLPPLAARHPRGPLCGTPSDLWRSRHSHRGQSSDPRLERELPETSRGPAQSPGASTLLEAPVGSAVDFGALSRGCKRQSC